jgi:hypothetical protein
MRFIPAGEPRPSYRGAAPARSAIAREKAIEKARIRTFHLECGHPCDFETAEFYDAFRILETSLGPGWIFCEKCHELGKEPWQRRVKPSRPAIPPEPLF